MSMLCMLDLMPCLSFLNGMALRNSEIAFRHSSKLFIILVEGSDLFLSEIFDINEPVARAFHRRDNLIQL
jgi:hypothetical protein